MEDAERKMIYRFYNKEPIGTEYVRGVCRIWPVDDYSYKTIYMDPAPNQGAGTIDVIIENTSTSEMMNTTLSSSQPILSSEYITAITKALEKLNIGKNSGTKGSRKWIANHKIIKQWKRNRSIQCGRLTSI